MNPDQLQRSDVEHLSLETMRRQFLAFVSAICDLKRENKRLKQENDNYSDMLSDAVNERNNWEEDYMELKRNFDLLQSQFTHH